MDGQPIRVGIVGAGANTRARHIPGLLALEGVQIVGVCNRSRESSQAVAGAFGIEKIYDNWRQAVADEEANAIVIGTWPYLHCPVTVAALEAGKHVLCEARMAMNAAEAHAMLRAACARPDLVAQIVPSPFTLHVDAGVRKLLEERVCGRHPRAGGSEAHHVRRRCEIHGVYGGRRAKHGRRRCGGPAADGRRGRGHLSGSRGHPLRLAIARTGDLAYHGGWRNLPTNTTRGTSDGG